ncbi:hypothetical protein PIB30_019781 [Stylosanthes scabra]|uniref:DUF1639 family protein n=1 Tax=Stylosanthes scabra TaxID=79078 RepID=A0ABU6Y6Q1_9FABA|nr:hypothetical protein [Stylosanthes scabra]
MGMVPERSKPLHNFSLPCLKWGSQKFLRCVNAPSNITTINSQPSSSSPDRRSSRLQSKPQIEPSRLPKRKSNQNFDGVPGMKLKVSNFEDGGGGGEEGGGGVSNRPWNLRTRRAACKAPPSASPQAQALITQTGSEEGNKLFDVGGSSSHYQVKDKKVMMMMMNERSKFSVSLSKEEVEQDFWGLVGTRPPRRPKKRPRIVQRQLDTLFPGLWLTEVNADCYKVAEVRE